MTPPQRIPLLFVGLLFGGAAAAAFVPNNNYNRMNSRQPTTQRPQHHHHSAKASSLPHPRTKLLVAAAADAFAATPTSSYDVFNDAAFLWSLRVTSAVTSYLGFVAYCDRPRGGLDAAVRLDRDIAVRPSPIPGARLGLYACRDLSAGTVLGHYPGTVLQPITAAHFDKLRQYPHCEAYIWRFSDNQALLDPTNRIGLLPDTQYCTGGNPALPGSVWWWETVFSWVLLSKSESSLLLPSTALCRINEPPKGFDVNVVTTEDLQRRTVTFQLERDVMAGEEFFIDYGLSYDRSHYGGSSSSSPLDVGSE